MKCGSVDGQQSYFLLQSTVHICISKLWSASYVRQFSAFLRADLLCINKTGLSCRRAEGLLMLHATAQQWHSYFNTDWHIPFIHI